MASSMLNCSACDFLLSVFSSRSRDGEERNTLSVTLTFAQSLDGKIAGKDGKQLLLSCPESMLMTHWMRSMHDAILVGIGTALNDNPQLNTRLIPEGLRPANLPRPVVLDTHLRLCIDCKLLNNFRQGTGLQPWIFYSSDSPEARERQPALIEAGAVLFGVSCEDGKNLPISSVLPYILAGLLSISHVLAELSKQNIKSLMVEGGSAVINSFLKYAYKPCDSGDSPVVDTLITTIAPTLVGDDGTGYTVVFSEKKHSDVGPGLLGSTLH
ncbi:dihydrofolate reductase-like domain-containing protein [Scleroderma yunnanense]